jgi:hypothetical protein
MNTNLSPMLKQNARILLISNMNIGPTHNNNLSKKEMLYDTLKKSKLVSEITIVSLDAIKDFNELILANYHCIIYDLLDCGCKRTNPTKEIENYIKNGGNIIVTHDHVYYILNILGLKEINNSDTNYIFNEVINVNSEHEIWRSYYNFEKIKIMEVTDTHGRLKVSNKETKTILVSNDNYNNLYLTTRNIGMGKAVFWNAGHTPDINENEKKLFLNIIAWVLKEEN